DLDEVHGLGTSLELKDIADYDPGVEKIFDNATDIFYKLEDLDEVHGLGTSLELKDIADYDPGVEKIFDNATDIFYKLEVSLHFHSCVEGEKECWGTCRCEAFSMSTYVNLRDIHKCI
nr:hypothetical protein [Tanacetum cinerariifolium]